MAPTGGAVPRPNSIWSLHLQLLLFQTSLPAKHYPNPGHLHDWLSWRACKVPCLSSLSFHLPLPPWGMCPSGWPSAHHYTWVPIPGGGEDFKCQAERLTMPSCTDKGKLIRTSFSGVKHIWTFTLLNCKGICNWGYLLKPGSYHLYRHPCQYPMSTSHEYHGPCTWKVWGR